MPEHTPAPTPHRAVYGFAFYLLFFTLFIIYVLWALFPLESIGLNYLPDKYFAAYLPMLVLVGFSLFIFFIYPAINLSMTPATDSLASVVDVSLVQRGREDVPLTSWRQLKFEEAPVDMEHQPTIENCSFCHETHRPSEMKPIETLRFVDLQEINKSVFGQNALQRKAQ